MKVRNLIFLSITILLMIATRGHFSWASSIVHLPDFTIPALLIAGVYFRNSWIALTLIIFAIAIDNYAITVQGVSANCITPAYSFLPFTYYAVFWSAKFLTSLKFDNNIAKNSIIVFSIVSMQWFLATISYYAFTKTFAENGFNGFGSYLLQWSVVEIPLTLYWIGVIFIISSFIPKYILTPKAIAR